MLARECHLGRRHFRDIFDIFDFFQPYITLILSFLAELESLEHATDINLVLLNMAFPTKPTPFIDLHSIVTRANDTGRLCKARLCHCGPL